MRVYVHIGTHKTGTTSIQAFLREHADALMSEGIYVPVAGTLGMDSGHHNIAWELEADPRFDGGRGSLDDLLRELAPVQAVSAVITSEDFEYLVDRPDTLARMERRLVAAGHEPVYVVFVRRPDSYAPSLYAELREHGLSCTYGRFVARILWAGKFVMKPGWTFHFSADAFTRSWRRAAARPLVICSYDDAAADRGVVPVFLSVINASDRLVRLGTGAARLNMRRPVAVPAILRRVAGRLLCTRFGVPAPWRGISGRPRCRGARADGPSADATVPRRAASGYRP